MFGIRKIQANISRKKMHVYSQGVFFVLVFGEARELATLPYVIL